MKQVMILLAVSLFVLSSPAFAIEPDPNLVQARGVVKQFGGALKEQMKSAMQAGGPVETLKVCNEKAPEIAKSISLSTGWQMGRTSLKTRNNGNLPLPWEKAVLQDFEERKAQRESLSGMEYVATVDVDGQRIFRYMKVIATEKVCLKCHAAEITAELQTELDKLYPSDRARGFKEGDIRGAFTLTKPL